MDDISVAPDLTPSSQNPPNFFSIDLSVSQLFRTSVSGGDNEGDEDAINILAEGSALKPLESAVLLVLVVCLIFDSHLRLMNWLRVHNKHLILPVILMTISVRIRVHHCVLILAGSVASVLREEELGETVPLTLASASGQ